MDNFIENTNKSNSKENIALDAMENLQDVDNDTLHQILDNKESLQECEDLWDLTYCMMVDNNVHNIDPVKELNRFNKKRISRAKQKLYKWAVSIAAVLILGFCGYFITMYATLNQPIIVFTADTYPQEIILQNENGETVVLTENQLIVPQATIALSPPKTISSNNSNEGKQVEDYFSEPLQVLTIPRGENFKITLSDGSEVWLNANSKFSYPVAFNASERIVMLEGEAYFKVAPNKEVPFIVMSPNITTRVLGTEFNIKDYASEESHVVLISGSVEVSNTLGKDYVMLTPGEEACLQPDGDFILNKVDVDSYVYWKEGFFYYDDLSLLSIMQDIGRWYNVNIEFHNSEALKYKMHFIADRSQGIEHVIVLLNRMKKVHATFEENTIIIE